MVEGGVMVVSSHHFSLVSRYYFRDFGLTRVVVISGVGSVLLKEDTNGLFQRVERNITTAAATVAVKGDVEKNKEEEENIFC